MLHGNRGRPCKYKLKDQILKRVVELALGKYRGFSDHHLSEKLNEEEKIEISREKVRRVLRSHGPHLASTEPTVSGKCSAMDL